MLNKDNTKILRVAIPSPLNKLFDYKALPNTTALVGTRVLAPFGRRTVIGLVIEITDKSDFDINKIKQIIKQVDSIPIFNKNLLKLICWANNYYHYSLGEIFCSGLPKSIRQGKELSELKLNNTEKLDVKETALSLNDEQELALNNIKKAFDIFKIFLLYGVTGSGKTEVYLQTIKKILDKQQQALLLIPEISLTTQTVSRLQKRFGSKVLLFHSNLTDKQRLTTWMKIRQNNAYIVVGTRSACFLPFNNLKLIVIDEEHDSSFKQQEGFKYSARDLSIKRASFNSIPIILGSATPSLETINNVNLNKFSELRLTKRNGNAVLPSFDVVDVRHKKLQGGLSNKLIARIQQTLDEGGQVLLYLNRRGYSPAFMCFDCGWLAECNRCDAKLTYHILKHTLDCHHCNKTIRLPKTCPTCKSEALNPLGAGTQRLEEVLQEKFPQESILRIDSDNTKKKGSMQEKLELINNKSARILIGTQMLAKGHHFPHLSLVVIVDVDGGLFSTDFRAVERMGQNILQVAGRAGRENKPGHVILQSFHPDHPLIKKLLFESYDSFIEELKVERKALSLPPYSHIALLRGEAKNKDNLKQALDSIAEYLLKQDNHSLSILGPVSAPMKKKVGNYRMQLLLKDTNRKNLHTKINILEHYLNNHPIVKKIRWSLDIDPSEML